MVKLDKDHVKGNISLLKNRRSPENLSYKRPLKVDHCQALDKDKGRSALGSREY